MSFSKNLTITVRNTVAQLDEPLYVYEKDRNLIMYFKIMDYKYKFDKNPTNVLASVDDIMEAYATIVDPNGYELTRQYGEVIEDEIKFVITDDLIDELDEIGTYRIQFHIKCQHSEFTIPEISFEVLERLKGFRTVTDEGEVGDEILNNSESFIDEEGKLHLVWREGDTISSVRLNQMVEVVNNAVDEEHQRQINEVNRENRANAKLDELETRFSALTTSQQQSAEVIDARDGETSLKARLDRDVKKPLEYYENVEGSYITTDSSAGYLKDVEILGNTVQDALNLAGIRSVGDTVEGQELYEIPVLSRGKNLLNSKMELGSISGGLINTSSTNQIRTVDFVRLKPNTDYVISGIPNYTVIFCTKNCEYITEVGRQGGTKFTTPGNCEYIKFRTYSSDNITNINTNIQIEEGTVATPYEPYVEDKLTILSPVQLEKVGDVEDRIIEKDGVWGVEKNVIDKLFNGSENWVLSGWAPQENTIAFKLQNIKNTNFGICDKFILNRTNSTIDTEVFNVDSVWNEISIRINKSKLSTQDVTGFKKWLSDNTVLIMYSDNTSTFIPLPHDQQVKLRTFANKTNISFLTEVEGTIKAQVPKSLGATVNTHTEQISNLNKELDRVKKLEESTVSTVETESDFTTVTETSNGYFEDVKLEGRTLVNLPYTKVDYFPSGDYATITSDSDIVCYEYKVKPNTIYTIAKFSDTDRGNIAIYSSNAIGTRAIGYHLSVVKNGRYYKLITESDANYMLVYLNSTSLSTDVPILVLEGDHTQNPPSYFEGLKSVGQDVDEIVVSSGKSLNFKLEQGTLSDVGTEMSYSNRVRTNHIQVSSGNIYINTSYKRCVFYKNGVFVRQQTEGELIVDHDVDSVRFAFEGELNNLSNIVITQLQDKKRLLYYNEETQSWEKPILREWDSIEKHADGKYYYHQRSGEVVLNGSEDWGARNMANENNTIGFGLYPGLPNYDINSLPPIICDRFTYMNANALWVSDEESTTHAGDYLHIRILKSKLSTQNVAGFKQWLQANNVTVVYQLAEEKVYECTNIDLITYANETNYIVESGAITPKTTLKVHSNIANVISALQKKVSVLESNYVTLFNTITVTFNSLE